MVLDTSVFVAILRDEKERADFIKAIKDAPVCFFSAASYVEASSVLENLMGYDGVRDLDSFIGEAKIEIVPVDMDQVRLARRGFHKYGKGRHPAALNYGDCFSYALSRLKQLPLLYKGNDFSQTDIMSAI